MAICDYCKESTDGLPHVCKFCGKVHCSKHLLPESHNCSGLEKLKERGKVVWKNAFYPEKETVTKKSHSMKKHPQKSFSKKIKENIHFKWDDFLFWLRKRTHYGYNYSKRKKYLLKIVLILCLSLLGLFFFYSRADQFNQVSLWIFNLGGILILTSLFFAIKYGWNFLKEAHNFYKRQRKWIKIVIVLILLILIWQGFSNGQILTEKVKTTYNGIEFSLLSPFSLSKIPGFSGQEVSLPSFFSKNSCSEIEQHAKNQYLSSAKYKKNFCGAICGQQNLEYQRYSCDKENKFHCFCKQIENE
ncbi:MAG: AN1-type zinc finger protein [Nanoarchaeota archaeon]|nr:AN1-type zinc finger protein [Nanoarchaeota archaeon]